MASPISKPLATISPGHWSNSLRADAVSFCTLNSGLDCAKFPAITLSSFTFRLTSSTSAGASSKRARFVLNPTCTMTTVPSRAAASNRRSSATASTASAPLGRRLNHLAVLRRDAAALHHPHRNLPAPVERVHQVHIHRRPRIVFRDRDPEQPALAAALQRVQHGQRQRIVHVVAHIGIENHRDRLRPRARRQKCRRRQSQKSLHTVPTLPHATICAYAPLDPAPPGARPARLRPGGRRNPVAYHPPHQRPPRPHDAAQKPPRRLRVSGPRDPPRA